MKNLSGKTAFITGAAGGIGRALANEFAHEGMQIGLSDLDPNRLEEIASKLKQNGIRVSTVALDVTNFQHWQAATAQIETELGPIKLLCNSAGTSTNGPLMETDPSLWKFVLEVNSLGPYYGCRTLLPKMLALGEQAHIVNIASLAGIQSQPGMSAYCASKHAIVGMSDSLRQELAETNVGLSLVCPGMVATDFTTNAHNLMEQHSAAAVQPLDDGAASFLKENGMDPKWVAKRIVAAVKGNEYFVYTHADYKPIIKAYYEERLNAYRENADPNYKEDIEGVLTEIVASRKGGETTT